MAITVWQERAERARKALAKFKEASESAVLHLRHDGETIFAGAAAGAVRGAFQASGKDYSIPAPGGGKIPPELVISGLLLAAAFSGQTEVSNDLHSLGSGVAAYSAGREAELYMTRRQKNGGPPPGTVQ